MNHRLTILMALLGTTAAGALAAPGASRAGAVPTAWHPTAASYTRTHDIPSHHGRYRASLTFDSTAETGELAGRITVVTRDGLPVTGARLALESSMPDHDSIPPVHPVVSEELGHGAYRVGGMRFGRDGLWTIRLTIATSIDGDSLAFNLIR